MKRLSIVTIGAAIWLCVASAQAGFAADILQYVPDDTLGFVVIRDLDATDAKVQRLLTNVQATSIGPLAFLRAATGIGDGLNSSGDFLLAAVPGNDAAAEPEICIWLPVKNYDRFLTSLGGQPASGVTAVTLAGEDLLVARQGDWALLMDPDQRPRLANMLIGGAAAPNRTASWRSWIAKNDITVVALPSGVRAILKMSTPANALSRGIDAAAREQADDDLFGAPDASDGMDEGIADLISSTLQSSVGALLSTSPQLVEVAESLQSLGCGVKFDDAGNARVGLRAAWPADARFLQGSTHSSSGLPPTIFDADEFVVHAAGTWPSSLTALVAGTYARLVVEELKAQEGIQLEDKTVSRYLQTVEQAATEVLSLNVLALAGEKLDGVYTNGFVVVRVASAAKFVDLVAEAMRLWNQMNREADGGPRLVFDVAELPIGNRTAVQYSLDLAAADGAPVIPEMRQAMERLFGPGGKLTIFVAKIDGETALLGAGTLEQTASMLQRLERKLPTDWNATQFVGVNRLLPQQAEWRAYFDPHGYTTWSARQMDAIVGVPVVGGPLVKEFPKTPPVGASGGFRDGELWIDFGVTVETIQGTGTYVQKLRARARR